MAGRFVSNILLVCVSLVLTLILLEIVVRVGGLTDADGQYAFMGHALEPYVLPVETLRINVQGYLANQDVSIVIYDEAQGWTYRPNSIRQTGTFTINGAGLRSRRDFSQIPPPDSMRIAVFGDSFAAGDDVNDDEVWGNQLEVMLNEAGVRAEVLNFGVGAYGMGQAFLRWQNSGKSFDPDIVIFGLQPENLARNVNVFRQLLHPSGPPFSKPRFYLSDQELELINYPTLPPEQLVAAFANFANHPLAPYEYHYRSRYVVSSWWSSSRLASLLFAAITQNEEDPDIFGPDSEGEQLGKAIIDAFAKDVMEEAKDFIVLHLPLQNHLIRYHNGAEPPYIALLDYCRETYHYIATEEHIAQSYVDGKYWSVTKHYGPEIHSLVAEVVAKNIIDCVESGACPMPRFDDPFQVLADYVATDG